MRLLLCLSLFSVSLLTSTSLLAIDQSACSKLLNNGMYKTYKYGGIDQPITKATKEHGITKSTSVTSTEGSTAISDPKYWSNITTSETQSTSSWGPCNLIGMNNVKESRNRYFAQNKDAVIKEVAQGSGEHLKVLASFSLCDREAYGDFAKTLQQNTGDFITAPNEGQLGNIIDNSVQGSKALSSHCYSYKI